MCMLVKCRNLVSRNIAHQICEKYSFLGKKYPKKSEKVDLVDLFSVMRRYRTNVSESVTLRTELTDVTLVSEDTY